HRLTALACSSEIDACFLGKPSMPGFLCHFPKRRFGALTLLRPCGLLGPPRLLGAGLSVVRPGPDYRPNFCPVTMISYPSNICSVNLQVFLVFFMISELANQGRRFRWQSRSGR